MPLAKLMNRFSAPPRNVAVQLVSKGLAHVIRYRQDDDQRSAHYDALMTAEAEAITQQKGNEFVSGLPIPTSAALSCQSNARNSGQFAPRDMC